VNKNICIRLTCLNQTKAGAPLKHLYFPCVTSCSDAGPKWLKSSVAYEKNTKTGPKAIHFKVNTARETAVSYDRAEVIAIASFPTPEQRALESLAKIPRGARASFLSHAIYKQQVINVNIRQR